MEKFEINLIGETLTVVSNENGRFTISKGDQNLGIVTPELTDAGVLWISTELSQDQAMQIGELIEEAQM